MANVSINKFSAAIGKNKGTVSRDCKTMGIDTTHGLTPQAQEDLRTRYGLTATVTKISESELQVIQPGDQLDDGPILPTSIDLRQWSIQPIQGMADPLKVAQDAIAIMDLISQGLDHHVAELKVRQESTSQAASQISDRQQELKLQTAMATLRSEFTQQDIKQSESVVSKVVQSLGK